MIERCKLNKPIDKEENIKLQYETLWSNEKNCDESQIFLNGWHFGFYEKGNEKDQEAYFNMHRYVDRLLDLSDFSSQNVLDVGCGIGTTSIFLAGKYPRHSFFGITLADNEVNIANLLKNKKNLENTSFINGSYLETKFKNEKFEKVFALESFCYATNKRHFLQEMHRILKPKGRIILIDVFRTKNSSIELLQNVNKKLLNNTLISEKNFTLDTIVSLLENENFKKILVNNLVKTKNVKLSSLYAFFFKNLFITLTMDYKNFFSPLKINDIIKKCTFPFVYLMKSIVIFKSKPSYFSIIAEKP